MTKAIARDPIYRGRRFQSETIELCVRWYITYRLSYRDLAAMMAERGIRVSHTTILRWVLRYVPEFERRWARYARRVNSSWRIDETSIPVRGRWRYLYRAVDKHGKSVDFLLCADRGMDAAKAFFRKAVVTHPPRWPRKVNLDGNAATHRALRLLGQEDSRWQSVLVRSRRYLNNIVEQDHRAIKRRCASLMGFKSFRTAAITLTGIELAHRVRKRQFSFGRGRQRRAWSLKTLWDRALASGCAVDRGHDCSPHPERPPLHQISFHRRRRVRGHMLTDEQITGIRPPAHPRKLSDARGLYLHVMPNGGRYWRYNYRFNGKVRTLALGAYPDISLATARIRHQDARRRLAEGIDPSIEKQASRPALQDGRHVPQCVHQRRGSRKTIPGARRQLPAATDGTRRRRAANHEQ